MKASAPSLVSNGDSKKPKKLRPFGIELLTKHDFYHIINIQSRGAYDILVILETPGNCIWCTTTEDVEVWNDIGWCAATKDVEVQNDIGWCATTKGVEVWNDKGKR